MNVSIELLEFPLYIENKILRIKNITKLNIKYIAGKNIVFKNSNLGLHEPHKIFISNGKEGIILLNYDNDPNVYNENLTRAITMNELTYLVNKLLIK